MLFTHVRLVAAFGLLASVPVQAEDPAETDHSQREALIAQPIPSRFCLSPADSSSADSGADNASAAGDEQSGLYSMAQTDGPLDRLLNTRRLELLTLSNDSTAVFFGVNERGRFGLHFDASQMMAP